MSSHYWERAGWSGILHNIILSVKNNFITSFFSKFAFVILHKFPQSIHRGQAIEGILCQFLPGYQVYNVRFGLKEALFNFAKPILPDWFSWWKWKIWVCQHRTGFSVYCVCLQLLNTKTKLEYLFIFPRIWCFVSQGWCANIWAATEIFIFTREILRRNLSPVYAERLKTVPAQLCWLCGYKM